MTYTLTITNTGAYPATGATFKDTMPVGITGVTAGNVSCGNPTGGAICGALGTSVTGSDAAGYVITGAVQSLPAGSSVQITINVNAPGAAGNISTLRPCNWPPPIPRWRNPSTGNNSATVSTTVQGTPAMSVTKTATLNDANGNGKADAGETSATASRPSTAAALC